MSATVGENTLSREEVIRLEREQKLKQEKAEKLGQSLQYDASSIKKTEIGGGGQGALAFGLLGVLAVGFFIS